MLISYAARMAVVFAREARKPRVGIFDEVRLPLRVWPTDLDPYFHLNNGRYLTLMDIGRYQMAIRTGLFRVMWARRWWPVLGEAQIQFRRELGFWHRFDLVTRFRTWDGKWFVIEQRFERDGRVHATATVRGVFRHRGKSLPIDEVVRAIGHEGGPPTGLGASEEGTR